MSIFGIKTDYIVISLNNNGSAYIVTEAGERETSRCDGEGWVANAGRFGYKKVDEVRYSNGDVKYWFN